MRIRPSHTAAVLAALLLPGGRAASQAPAEALADTLRLGEVRVDGSATRRPRVAADGSVSFAAEALRRAPRVLGEADPLRFAASMPGVGAASDYASGMSVDGMDYSHNLYLLNGIPVHFPYHFGGIFSVFSPELYNRARLRKSIKGADAGGTLGGVVDLGSAATDSLSGTVNAGMLASSAYVAAPLGSRLTLQASGRVSYIDALYSGLLRSRSTQAAYNLADCDIAACYHPTDRDHIKITAHYNTDNVEYTDRNYSLTTALRWHNLAAGAEWERTTDALEMTNRLYFTSFRNRLGLSMEQIELKAPTAIDEWGAAGSFDFAALPAGWSLTAGYSLRLYSVTPQYVELSGLGQGGAERRGAERSLEASAYAEARRELPRGWSVTAGLPLNLYTAGNYTRFHPDPRLTVAKRWRHGALTLHAGRYHQYLHQVGFSDLGMSSNFKLAASRRVPPQECLTFAAAGNFAAGRSVYISADIYYKVIRRQPEYLGAILDILNAGYVAENYVLSTRGHNIGGSLSARGEFGPVNASLAYAYCLTRRRMAGEPGVFSASNELRHTLRAGASWDIGSHWTLSAAFSLASGRPYTPVTAIYFIGEQLMMEYGPRNSARLPAYHRLDLGASYRFRTGGRFPLRHEVGLSVINAYGRANVEMSSFALDTEEGTFYRRDVSSLYRFLPSLNYTVSF